MTNYEFYEKEIIEIIGSGSIIAIVNGTPKPCSVVACKECSLSGERELGVAEWLAEEHISSELGKQTIKTYEETLEIVNSLIDTLMKHDVSLADIFDTKIFDNIIGIAECLHLDYMKRRKQEIMHRWEETQDETN